MTQVSRHPLPKTTWERISSLFLHSLATITNPTDLSTFLKDLLSLSERIMLAKRLAIALLLTKQQSYDSIRQRLHVTPGTIAKVQRQLQEGHGGLQIGINKILVQQSNQALWEQLKNLLDIAPPSFYKSAWGKRKYQRRQNIQQLKTSI